MSTYLVYECGALYAAGVLDAYVNPIPTRFLAPHRFIVLKFQHWNFYVLATHRFIVLEFQHWNFYVPRL